MQATTPEYRAYQEQVLSNSAKFAQVKSMKYAVPRSIVKSIVYFWENAQVPHNLCLKFQINTYAKLKSYLLPPNLFL